MKSQYRNVEKEWRYRKMLFFIIAIILPATGCYYDKEELLYPDGAVDCTTVPATFNDVKTIMTGKCATAGCHNAATAAGNTVLETYDQVKAKSSRINQRVVIERTMPPGTTLSANEIAVLKCWLSSSMPNN